MAPPPCSLKRPLYPTGLPSAKRRGLPLSHVWGLIGNMLDDQILQAVMQKFLLPDYKPSFELTAVADVFGQFTISETMKRYCINKQALKQLIQDLALTSAIEAKREGELLYEANQTQLKLRADLAAANSKLRKYKTKMKVQKQQIDHMASTNYDFRIRGPERRPRLLARYNSVIAEAEARELLLGRAESRCEHYVEVITQMGGDMAAIKEDEENKHMMGYWFEQYTALNKALTGVKQENENMTAQLLEQIEELHADRRKLWKEKKKLLGAKSSAVKQAAMQAALKKRIIQEFDEELHAAISKKEYVMQRHLSEIKQASRRKDNEIKELEYELATALRKKDEVLHKRDSGINEAVRLKEKANEELRNQLRVAHLKIEVLVSKTGVSVDDVRDPFEPPTFAEIARMGQLQVIMVSPPDQNAASKKLTRDMSDTATTASESLDQICSVQDLMETGKGMVDGVKDEQGAREMISLKDTTTTAYNKGPKLGDLWVYVEMMVSLFLVIAWLVFGLMQ